MANELTRRKATLAALGVTGSTQNEAEYAKSLTAGLASNSKTKPAVVALTASVVANATDLASAVALANDLKTKVNAIIAAIKA